jgi:hypothetical protein
MDAKRAARGGLGPAERAEYLVSVRLFQRLPKEVLGMVAEQFTVSASGQNLEAT